MKKTIFAFSLLILLSALASASIGQFLNLSLNVTQNQTKTVAYIYSKGYAVNSLVIKELESLNYNVSKIQYNKLSETNLSNFTLVFIGDENFRYPSSLQVGDFPVVIINHFNLRDFGLSDNDGASILGSSAPLSVVSNGISLEVYKKAALSERVPPHYIFLNKNNIAPNLQSIAYTQPTSSGKNLGTVIAHAPKGTALNNGKVTKKNLCFFGIKGSYYWTQSSRDLFSDCVRFASS